MIIHITLAESFLLISPLKTITSVAVFFPCNTRGDVLLIVQTALFFFHKMKVNGNQGLKGSKMTSTTAVDNLTCNAQVKWTCGAFHFQVF